jgi:competence protein ComEC
MLTTNREKPPDFIFEQWQRALAITEQQPPTILPPDSRLPKISKSDNHRHLSSDEQTVVRKAMDAALDNAGQGGFACQKRAWCVAMLDDGNMLVTIEDAAYLAPACDTANIVVTPVRLRLDRCRSGAMLFTGATLRRTGSIEMDLSADKPMITATFQTLTRPWNLHRAYDWRTGTFGAPIASVSPVSDNGE